VSSDPIVAIEVELRTKSLPRELRLGDMRLTERTYVAVTISTAAGLSGIAVAQTRGSPVDRIIDDSLVPILLGADSSEIGVCWDRMFRSTIGVGRSGLVMRAISLIDIALWDIQAKRAGLPLYKLLGGSTISKVPAIFVAGYAIDDSEVGEVVAAGVTAAHQGHGLIKVARSPHPATTARLLHELAEQIPDSTQVVVDGSWRWSRVDEVLTELQSWPLERIAWLEDPLVPENVEAYVALHRRSPVSIGAGDEVTDHRVQERLVEAGGLDVVRLDVATLGGVSATIRALHRLEGSGLPISLHISPEVSIHLAAAFPAISSAETFDRSGNRFDPIHELFYPDIHVTHGSINLPDSPGLGVELSQKN
jgi:L-alanine-DL-glutamate epimerase-like enolase superfamily enzyme